MSGHTPGPWVVGISADNGIHCVDSGTTEVCEVWGTANDKIETAESQANARLIAAAPELLDELEALASRCDVVATEDGSNIDTQAARAVIAKAKGEA